MTRWAGWEAKVVSGEISTLKSFSGPSPPLLARLYSWQHMFVFFRTIFGDRSGGNPFAGGINFGQVKVSSYQQTPLIIITFQTGGAEQFDFGPKEYHVTLSFQQAAMGVCKLNIGWFLT